MGAAGIEILSHDQSLGTGFRAGRGAGDALPGTTIHGGQNIGAAGFERRVQPHRVTLETAGDGRFGTGAVEHMEKAGQGAFLPVEPALFVGGTLVADQVRLLQRPLAQRSRQGMGPGFGGGGCQLGGIGGDGLGIGGANRVVAGPFPVLAGQPGPAVHAGNAVVLRDPLVQGNDLGHPPLPVLGEPFGPGGVEEENIGIGLGPADFAHDALDGGQHPRGRFRRILRRELDHRQPQGHIVLHHLGVGPERPEPGTGLRQALVHHPQAGLGIAPAEGTGKQAGQVLPARRLHRRRGRAAEADQTDVLARRQGAGEVGQAGARRDPGRSRPQRGNQSEQGKRGKVRGHGDASFSWPGI